MSFDEITDSNQLLLILNKLYPDYDNHVIAIDQLKTIAPKMKQIIICNYRKMTENGTHWVCIACKEVQYAVYFDSFGLDPPKEIIAFMRLYKPKLTKAIVSNIRKIQPLAGEGSSACGWFILDFIRQYIGKDQIIYRAIDSMTIKKSVGYGKYLTKKYLKHEPRKSKNEPRKSIEGESIVEDIGKFAKNAFDTIFSSKPNATNYSKLTSQDWDKMYRSNQSNAATGNNILKFLQGLDFLK